MTDQSSETRGLFLEDSAVDAELVIQHLSADPNLRIDWVRDRSSFLSELQPGRYDIVLIDYCLPDFDGLEALDLVFQRLPETPVVFLSGVAGEELVNEAIARGASDYVLKKNLRHLSAVMSRALARSLERTRRTRERDRIWRLSRDLFAVLDARGVVRAANPSWWRTLGLQEEQLLGASLRTLIHIQDAARFDTMFEALGQEQPVEHAEMRLRRRDGVLRWISWTAVPQGGEIYAVGRDVTDVKQAAADLEQATATLKVEVEERLRVEATLQHLQRIEAIGQVAAGVAHDFNNLLAAVLGNTVLLERMIATRGGEQEAVHLSRIRRAIEGGSRVTRQLLAFSRPRPIVPQTLDLNEAVSGILDLLKSSLGGSIQFSTRLREGLWTTWADRTQLEMALLNLVINARDAMPLGGTISVSTDNAHFDRASAPADLPDGDYVSVRVNDTGTGIPPDVLSRLFEPFFTTKEPGSGSGLGLPQVSQFASRASGGIDIETAVGVGTTVTIYMPRAIAAHDAELPAAAVALQGAGASQSGHVLVVDDDPAARAVTVSILEEGGHVVFEAGSGALALEMLTLHRIDVMVVDYAMPVLNGAETARLAQELKPGLPIVFLTGYAGIPGLRDIHAYRVVGKPCSDEALRDEVAAAMGSSPG